MAVIQVKNLSFTYEGSAEPVFSGLDFHMDSSWRLGLVGRNGRGKTTLLRLLAGRLKGEGQILCGLPLMLFPFDAGSGKPAIDALPDALAPYTGWEEEMAACLKANTQEALKRYAEAEALYAAADGYVIREALKREAALLGFGAGDLGRPLSTFSPGEQTRLKLAALFLRPGYFLLIDEPTNHLDDAGRQKMADYLRQKSGFLIVSHERDFLDAVCDHILALERQGARVVNGNYSSYRENKRLRDEFERASQQRIQQDIDRLRVSARQKSGWSDRVEASKIGEGAYDRGYIGAKSAKMMKRAKTIENRVSKQLAEKESLLQNLEYASPLKLRPLPPPAPVLVRFEKVCFSYPGKPLLKNLDLELGRGERLALTGKNGAGKSTALRLILGDLSPDSGSVFTPRGLIISHLPQTSRGITGTPRLMAERRGLDLTLFLTLLRKFDLPREAFDRDITGLSLGQKKKVLLALTLAEPAQLYLWDEPLNDIDPESRDQLEDLLRETSATLLFIEHERMFIQRVATRELRLP